MNLDVPFYKQTTSLNCGPTALRMILAFFNNKKDIKEIEQAVGIKKGKGVSTIKLAITARELGHPTEFFTKSLFFDESHLQEQFYQKHGDINEEESKKLVIRAKKKGVILEEKSITITELLSKVTANTIPLVLVDWSIITQQKNGYIGHFIPLVGHDENSVYVHQQGSTNPTAFLKINKKLFDRARKAKGTDEDVVIIHRK